MFASQILSFSGLSTNAEFTPYQDYTCQFWRVILQGGWEFQHKVQNNHPTPRIQLSVRPFVRSSVPIFYMHHTNMHHKNIPHIYLHPAYMHHAYIHYTYTHHVFKHHTYTHQVQRYVHHTLRHHTYMHQEQGS